MRKFAISIFVAALVLYILSSAPVISHYSQANWIMPLFMRQIYHPLVIYGPDEITSRYLEYWDLSMIEAYFMTYPEENREIEEIITSKS